MSSLLLQLAVAAVAATSTVISSPPVEVVSSLNNLQDMFTHGNGFLACGMGGHFNSPKGCEPTNSTTQAKFLGKMDSASACSAACSTFAYRGVFPCRSFTFFEANYGSNKTAAGWRRLCYGRIDNVWRGKGSPTPPNDGAVTSGLMTVHASFIHFVHCKLEGTAGIGIGFIAVASAPMIPSSHPYVRDTHFVLTLRIFNDVPR